LSPEVDHASKSRYRPLCGTGKREPGPSCTGAFLAVHSTASVPRDPPVRHRVAVWRLSFPYSPLTPSPPRNTGGPQPFSSSSNVGVSAGIQLPSFFKGHSLHERRASSGRSMSECRDSFSQQYECPATDDGEGQVGRVVVEVRAGRGTCVEVRGRCVPVKSLPDTTEFHTPRKILRISGPAPLFGTPSKLGVIKMTRLRPPPTHSRRPSTHLLAISRTSHALHAPPPSPWAAVRAPVYCTDS
jgi:hypothetical protein